MSARLADPGALAAVGALLREAFDAADVRVSGARRLAGGAIQENWVFDARVEGGARAGRHALVLRTDAPSGLCASLSRAQEFAVLQAAHDAGVTVPEPVLLCEDPAVIGRSFYVMGFRAGLAAGHRLVRDDAVDGEALVQRLGEELGRLHRIRPPFPGLDGLAQPDLPPALYRVNSYRMYLDLIPQPQPALEWALRWLERFAPQDETLVLCHGDFRTGNYLVQEGALSAILDWEFAAWSHPHEDLGWLCARCWRFGRTDRDVGGMGSREALYRGYESSSGVSVDGAAIPYWEVMAAVRWAVLALHQGQRHLSGEQRSLELALTARMAPEMEYDALVEIERIQRRATP